MKTIGGYEVSWAPLSIKVASFSFQFLTSLRIYWDGAIAVNVKYIHAYGAAVRLLLVHALFT